MFLQSNSSGTFGGPNDFIDNSMALNKRREFMGYLSQRIVSTVSVSDHD